MASTGGTTAAALVPGKSRVVGKIAASPSKSQTLRAILFASMGEGVSHVENALDSPDVDAMRAACRALGATITGDKIIGVNGQPGPAGLINAGNSGIVLRFIGALASLSSATLTGDASCRKRPVGPLLTGLHQWNAQVEGMSIAGPLGEGVACINGSDSQPVSGLLITASYAPGVRELVVDPIGERPWLDLTLQWLRGLGAQIEENGNTFRIVGGLRHPGFIYRVPGDFSSAAFPLVAGLIAGDVELTGLDPSDGQGDKQLIDVLDSMGGSISHSHATQSALCGRVIDVNEMIDALPILAVVGCFASGETLLTNAAIARRKECDRIAAICTELRKMEADIEERPDGLLVRRSKLTGARVSSHGDHRIAMSLAVAALGATGSTHISDIDCIAKTYQTFWRDLQQLGVTCDFNRPSGGGQDDARASVGAGAGSALL